MPPKQAAGSRPRGRRPSKNATANSNAGSSGRKTSGSHTSGIQKRSGRPAQKKSGGAAAARRAAAGEDDSDVDAPQGSDDAGGDEEEDDDDEGDVFQDRSAVDVDDDDEAEDDQVNEDDAGAHSGIPPELLTRLLHDAFEKKTTRITKTANAALAKYMDTFAREAIVRAVMERPGAGPALEAEDLERVAPQLLLDL